jgi:hypothetical protein
LCAAALAWIVAILLLLLYMTAISMSHHALVVTLRVMAIISGCALAYVVARRLGPRAKLSPDAAE